MQPEEPYRAGIRAIVDEFPPLSRARRDELAAIFAPVIERQAVKHRPAVRGGDRAA